MVVPTMSMSGVRTHFWMLVARFHGGVCSSRKYGLSGTMPAGDQQQGRVVGDQRGGRHDGVPAALEEREEAAVDLSGLHQWPIGSVRAGLR